MKKSIQHDHALRQLPKADYTGIFKCLTTTLVILTFSFASCKHDKEQQMKPVASAKTAASTSAAQPLPGGKTNFTWVNGNFDLNGYTWERIVNLTFTASTGTVTATLWTWDSTVKKGKTAFNTHRCTFDGNTSFCSTWTPTGWVYPAGQYVNWSGTYVFNTTTNRLDITWTSGATATESWTITNPTPTIARASLITSSYTLTHGRGYGSNAPWTTYKTITQMVPFSQWVFTSTNSRKVAGSYQTGRTPALQITPATGFNSWASTSLNLSNFTTPSSPSPSNTMHHWDAASTACQGGCATTRPGIVYHLSTMNNSRQMAYVNFCACLSQDTNSENTFPCYNGNNHPSAFMQIIDDNGALVGFVGIEAQNPAGSSYNGNYQFHLWDFNNIP